MGVPEPTPPSGIPSTLAPGRALRLAAIVVTPASVVVPRRLVAVVVRGLVAGVVAVGGLIAGTVIGTRGGVRAVVTGRAAAVSRRVGGAIPRAAGAIVAHLRLAVAVVRQAGRIAEIALLAAHVREHRRPSLLAERLLHHPRRPRALLRHHALRLHALLNTPPD